MVHCSIVGNDHCPASVQACIVPVRGIFGGTSHSACLHALCFGLSSQWWQCLMCFRDVSVCPFVGTQCNGSSLLSHSRSANRICFLFEQFALVTLASPRRVQPGQVCKSHRTAVCNIVLSNEVAAEEDVLMPRPSAMQCTVNRAMISSTDLVGSQSTPASGKHGSIVSLSTGA